MIKQTLIKPIETKPAKASDLLSKSQDVKKNQKDSSSSVEFASELKAASDAPKVAKKSEVKDDKEEKTQAKAKTADLPAESLLPQVKVSPEQSAELDTNPDALIPKSFDPAMTQDVQDLINPKSAEGDLEVPELSVEEMKLLAVAEVAPEEAKAEIAQALLKTPQVKDLGRSPAIELAETEVDPKLMNMEDFVAQKNLATKKSMPVNGYGIQKPQVQRHAIESGLTALQVVKEGENVNNDSVKSQQFILNMQSDNNTNSKANEVSSPVKVFDMNNVKTSNPTEIMTKISDYIMQAKASSEPTVTMRMSHQDLGMVDITVAKALEGAVAINIGTHSLEGKSFFQTNSKDLTAHLASAGVSVSDLKIETPTQTAKNDFDMNQQSQSGRQEQSRHTDQQQRRQDSDRRQDLWKQYRDNREAA